MTELDRLRFYLRDPAGVDEFFSDAELTELLDATESFEEAVGLGWLVKASAAATSTTTAGAVSAKTIGKVTTRYESGGTSTSADTAFALSRYWFSRAGRNVARWLEMQPVGGFIGETIDVIRALETGDNEYDLSRLFI